MMRSMAASMDGSVARSGNERFGLESGDRLVGKPDLVVLAPLEQLHDDAEQTFIGCESIGDRAGPAQIVGCDGVGFAHHLDIHHLQTAFEQHVQVLRYGWIMRSTKISCKSGHHVFHTINTKAHRTRKSPVPMRFMGSIALVLTAAGLFLPPLGRQFSETIEDLVGPEPLEAVQRLVQRGELLARDAADLLNRLDVLLVERVDDLADLLALRGQADTHRAAINARALMIKEAKLNELLQIVGDVRAEIVAAGTQLTGSQLLVADVIEQQRLHRIDIGAAAAVEFVLDDVEQAAMQPLNESQSFEIERLHPRLASSTVSGFHRRRNGFHHDTSPVVVFIDTYSTKLLSRLIATT